MHRRALFLAPIMALAVGCAGDLQSRLGSTDTPIVASEPDLHTPVSLPAPAAQAAVGSASPAASRTPLAPTRIPLPGGPTAPVIQSDTWINSTPLAWDSLRGKVVMVEFWTFGCINCRNVIPSLKGMYADYRDRGFIILGVHSPEFSHERELANVQKAVNDLGIEYPVALDNDFANWRRYRNRYWPARYLVDKRGIIRFTHIGEGGYDETRQWIEKLLAE